MTLEELSVCLKKWLDAYKPIFLPFKFCIMYLDTFVPSLLSVPRCVINVKKNYFGQFIKKRFLDCLT